jgi:hypothetical protein
MSLESTVIDPTLVGMPAYALVLNMLAIGASVKNIFFVKA